VTHVPLRVDDADVLMPSDFLDEFDSVEKREIGEGLIVETFRR